MLSQKGLFGKKKETPSKAIKQNQETLDRIAAEQAAAAVPLLLLLTKGGYCCNYHYQPKLLRRVKLLTFRKNWVWLIDGHPGRKAGSETNMEYAAKYGLDKGHYF
jgi:hypothetical protein